MIEILQGDCLSVLRTLPERSVQMCVTSPPYFGLRNYNCEGQIGLESSVDEYVAKMVGVFREVRRVLRDDGVLWLNLGDAYAGGNGIGRNDAGRNFTGGGGNKLGSGNPGRQGAHHRETGLKPKDLIGIPWRVAFALQADGWYLRADCIWHKPNAMPESVRDRPTKSHEYLFLLSKQERYYYDHEAVKEKSVDPESHRGRNKRNDDRFVGQPMSETRSGFSKIAAGKKYPTRNRRTVWSIPTRSLKDAHFATYPPKLIEPCILAGSRPGDVVLDPFFGAGTTGLVALEHGRKCLGIELNPEYIEIARRRLGLAEKDAA